MAQRATQRKNRKIENYARTDKKRARSSPVGIVTPGTDPDALPQCYCKTCGSPGPASPSAVSSSTRHFPRQAEVKKTGRSLPDCPEPCSIQTGLRHASVMLPRLSRPVRAAAPPSRSLRAWTKRAWHQRTSGNLQKETLRIAG